VRATNVNDLHRASALDLATMIRTGRVSSREVVESHIARVRRVNPHVNAMVRDRFDDARAEADAADARLAQGVDGLPLLHGVPCTIKESFSVTGMPWTAGLVSRRDVRADADAVTVQRLRAAGAIVLGVTNTSELCMWMESVNRVYGRTTSAYDTGRTSGGSSGGEGAMVGTGASPFGLGSDIGGSIRMPAFFNGVFGHKPSGGLVPASGQYPQAMGAAALMLSTGPLTRSARDLMPLLRLLAGPDAGDPMCRAMHLGDPSAVDLSTVTVHDVRDNKSLQRFPIETALLDAQEAAVQALARRGARIVKTSVPGLADAFELWSAAMHERNHVSFAELLGGEGGPMSTAAVLRELPSSILGRSDFTLPALGLALVEHIPALLTARMQSMVARIERLRGRVDALLQSRDLMLFPSHPRVAPKHHTALLTVPDAGFTGVFNVLEVPVTQVPLGLDARALPVGVQVIGARGQDHVPIAAAIALEEALGGWVPPATWS
jgi:fatty acid amide hydrolase 2